MFSEKPFKPAAVVGDNKTGNRTALAQWIASPEHPLTARVWVNRWKHHFGRGIVSSLDNFGKIGAAHIRLCWIGWRGIGGKPVEYQASAPAHLHQCGVSAVITENRNGRAIGSRDYLLSHMPMRRLDAEELHDGLIAITGRLNPGRAASVDKVQVRGRLCDRRTGRRRMAAQRVHPTTAETHDDTAGDL